MAKTRNCENCGMFEKAPGQSGWCFGCRNGNRVCGTCKNYSIIEFDGLPQDQCVFCMDRRVVGEVLQGTYRYEAFHGSPAGLVDVYYAPLNLNPNHFVVTITDSNGIEQDRMDALGVIGTLQLMRTTGTPHVDK